MTSATLLASFRSSLNAGESRRSAHQTVANEVSDLIGELYANDCDAGELTALEQWWHGVDYRTI
jgi:hypothetical protein